MAKTKISEYSSTANSNTDIASINIDEGCAPSGINNAIRALMAQIHDLYAGTSGDTWPVTAGGTGSGTASGARTNLGLVIGTDVQAYDADLAAIASSGKGAEIASYGTYGVGFKNRIINGAMMIDQRNAGASVTPTDGQYTLDRWAAALSQSSKYTVQQNAGSVTPPVGYTKYLGVTSSSAYSVGSSDFFFISTKIEGLNIADFAWGTASATTVTLSFKVYSSLTGTFGGALRNSGASRCYPFSYTISSANTWTSISITIAGDTSGTWLTTNGIGLEVDFNLGTGSTYSGTAGAWASANYVSATGATSVVGTSGATFYITGVQLEKGSTATSFDYRPYGTELSLCQRYYQRITRTSASTSDVTGAFASGSAWTNAYQAIISFPVTMRSSPSIDASTATGFQFHIGGVTNTALNSMSFSQSNVDGVRLTGGWTYSGTAGLSGQVAAYNATAYIGFNSEL